MEGLDKLNRKLAALPKAFRDEIRAAMVKGAEEMVGMAKRLAPVDSGALRDSIGWTWGDAPAGAMTLAEGTAGDLKITIYAGTRDKSLGDRDAFYAAFVEFGTVKMPANPFFYPSWRTLKKRLISRNSRAVRAAAKKVAGSGT